MKALGQDFCSSRAAALASFQLSPATVTVSQSTNQRSVWHSLNQSEASITCHNHVYFLSSQLLNHHGHGAPGYEQFQLLVNLLRRHSHGHPCITTTAANELSCSSPKISTLFSFTGKRELHHLPDRLLHGVSNTSDLEAAARLKILKLEEDISAEDVGERRTVNERCLYVKLVLHAAVLTTLILTQEKYSADMKQVLIYWILQNIVKIGGKYKMIRRKRVYTPFIYNNREV